VILSSLTLTGPALGLRVPPADKPPPAPERRRENDEDNLPDVPDRIRHEPDCVIRNPALMVAEGGDISALSQLAPVNWVARLVCAC
jgi:hypothetical protein